MEPRDITNEILIGIRDEIRLTNARLDGQQRILIRVADDLGDLNGRVDHLTGRVDHLTGRVDHLTGRVDHLTGRVDILTGHVEHLTGAMEQVHARLDRHDVRFAVITDILGRMDRRFERVEGLLDRALDVAASPAFVDLQRRVEALEHKAG